MLVLSRKLGEKILIGDDIVITVVDIDQGKIRLGIDAPKGVKVDRQEIRIRKERQSAENQSAESHTPPSQPEPGPDADLQT